MPDKDEKKVLPINKYSIYELKAGIDKEIQTYLEDEDFITSQRLSNLKILVGLLTVTCTGVAYLYPKPFPQNYYIILFSVIGYMIFSTVYWYVDKKVIGNIFYIGSNENFCQKYRRTKHNKVKEIIFHSDIEEKDSSIYDLWFDFITLENGKKITSEKQQIKCTEVYDERGYIHKDNVIKLFMNIFKKEVAKFD